MTLPVELGAILVLVVLLRSINPLWEQLSPARGGEPLQPVTNCMPSPTSASPINEDWLALLVCAREYAHFFDSVCKGAVSVAKGPRVCRIK